MNIGVDVFIDPEAHPGWYSMDESDRREQLVEIAAGMVHFNAPVEFTIERRTRGRKDSQA